MRTLLAGTGAGLALGWDRLPARWRTAALAIAALAAVANYYAFDPTSLVARVDVYDLFHYYLGAKYADELGQLDLYPCAILADDDAGPAFPGVTATYLAQDAPSGRHATRPLDDALARGRLVRATRFSEARWRAFAGDMVALERVNRPRMTGAMWAELVNDHGFNATPAWTMVAAPIAARVPVERVKALGAIDVVLLAGAGALVARAYGVDVALWALLFGAVTFSTRWPVVSWGFLRYDHVAALMVALCGLRLGRPWLAGAALGAGAALRVVPAVWAWGVAAWALGARRHWRGRWRTSAAFAVGALLVAGALDGAAIARFGPAHTALWARNLADQQTPDQLPSRAVGLAVALAWRPTSDPVGWGADVKARLADQGALRVVVAVGALALLGWALARTAAVDEAAGYGFVALYLLASPEYYYASTRLTLVLAHAAAAHRVRDRVGLAILFAIDAGSTAARWMWPPALAWQNGALSWALGGYACAIGGWVVADAVRAVRAGGVQDVG